MVLKRAVSFDAFLENERPNCNKTMAMIMVNGCSNAYKREIASCMTPGVLSDLKPRSFEK